MSVSPNQSYRYIGFVVKFTYSNEYNLSNTTYITYVYGANESNRTNNQHRVCLENTVNRRKRRVTNEGVIVKPDINLPGLRQLMAVTWLVWLNALRSSGAYMRRLPMPTLVQMMAWVLVGAKPLSEPKLEYLYFTPRNKLQLYFNQNSLIFIHENAFENVVWKMAVILTRSQCVNTFVW